MHSERNVKKILIVTYVISPGNRFLQYEAIANSGISIWVLEKVSGMYEVQRFHTAQRQEGSK